MLAHGRWFSQGTLASSNTKTGRHDIAEILLKVALKHKKSKSNPFITPHGRPTTAHSMQFIDSPLLKTIRLKEA